MSNQLTKEEETKSILLTEQLVMYYSTGCEPTSEMIAMASQLGINVANVRKCVESLYEPLEEGDEYDTWY